MDLAIKILCNLLLASVITAVFVYIIYSNDDYKEFVAGDVGKKILVFALLLAFITLATLACFKGKLY